MPNPSPLLRALSAAPLLLAVGCAAPTEGTEDRAYVLLDAEARTHGRLVMDGYEGAPVLPIALEVDEEVTYVGARRTSPVALERGSLTVLEGRDGVPRTLRVGTETRDDALFLQATTEAAAELALQLGGEVRLDANGLYRLDVTDVLERGSFVDAPRGVVSAEPVPVDLVENSGLEETLAPFGGGPALPLLDAEGQRLDDGGERDAEVVGLYGLGDRVLLLDASGRATLLAPCNAAPLRAGVFHTRGGTVFVTFGAERWALSRAGDALLTPDGDTLFPLLAEEPRR